MCVDKHYAKFKYKGMETVGTYSLHTDYTMKAPKRWCRRNNVQVKQYNIKYAQNRRCTSSMCEQSLCKV